jgi:hypothetical protein
MFFHVFQDEKRTLELMRRIFPELDITAVRLHEQEVRKEDKEGKGIRIDLFVAGHSVLGEADYVVEMQTENTGDLGYRIRYYKSLVDLGSLRCFCYCKILHSANPARDRLAKISLHF